MTWHKIRMAVYGSLNIQYPHSANKAGTIIEKSPASSQISEFQEISNQEIGILLDFWTKSLNKSDKILMNNSSLN